MTDDDEGSWIALEAATRNVTALLWLRSKPHGPGSKRFSPGGKANVTEGSLSPEGREPKKTPGETVKDAAPAVLGLGEDSTAGASSPQDATTERGGLVMASPSEKGNVSSQKGRSAHKILRGFRA
jgi:hypothetical protein